MSDRALSNEEWMPHSSNPKSEDTLEDGFSDEISSDDEQVVSDGWRLLTDPFSDVQSNHVPPLTTL